MARKPMLTSDQLIDHLKAKGVSFNIISEGDAKIHLAHHNNYFKLSAYRKNYTKYDKGVNAGKYVELDFAYLIELARLDTEIRHLLLQMTLDIEHFLKVALIKAVEDQMSSGSGEDGYSVIQGFLLADECQSISERAQKASGRTNSFCRKISQNKTNSYCGGLINSYTEEMPVWTFVELASFGDIKDLIQYYSTKTGWKPPVDIMSLDRVRQLRNACAHGNCIINDLKPITNQQKNGISKAPSFITAFVKSAGISEAARKKRLSNPRINQIVHLLYCYDIIVTSKNTRNKRLEELHSLIETRCKENAQFFQTNLMLVSIYSFFEKITKGMEKI